MRYMHKTDYFLQVVTHIKKGLLQVLTFDNLQKCIAYFRILKI